VRRSGPRAGAATGGGSRGGLNAMVVEAVVVECDGSASPWAEREERESRERRERRWKRRSVERGKSDKL
jgi:hypothetical protein